MSEVLFLSFCNIAGFPDVWICVGTGFVDFRECGLDDLCAEQIEVVFFLALI